MFHPWHDVPNDPNGETFTAVMEIPRGSKIKYELDKHSGLIKVDRILASSTVYPANYGFFPRSYDHDGDPLDVLVLGDHAFVPGSLVEVKPIGVMGMIDGGDVDDKIIAVCAGDRDWRDYNDLSELPEHRALEIKQFFLDYKTLEKKKVEVTGLYGAAKAREILSACFKLYADHEAELRAST